MILLRTLRVGFGCPVRHWQWHAAVAGTSRYECFCRQLLLLAPSSYSFRSCKRPSSTIHALDETSRASNNAVAYEMNPIKGQRRSMRKAKPTAPTAKGSRPFYDARWEESFQKLRSLMEHSSRPDRKDSPMPIDMRLRRWMSRQKLEYRKKCNGKATMLSDQRVELLKSVGFSFQVQHKRSWDNVYEQLCDYVKRNDGVFPSENAENSSGEDSEEQRLFQWCQRQRVNYTYFRLKGRPRRSTLMTEERIAKLDEINFSWSLRDAFWEEKYAELLEYHRHHNDCLVPAAYVSNISLAKWVERQRKQYLLLKQNKPSGLTEQRLALLNELDFVWDASEHKWRQKYKELTEYQSNNGQGMLPRKNDPDMAHIHRWLIYQRDMYRKWVNGEKSSLTSERIALLERAGVQWSEK